VFRGFQTANAADHAGAGTGATLRPKPAHAPARPKAGLPSSDAEGLTRARVTQIMPLLRLAPDIQQSILSLAGGPNPPTISELTLRPIAYLQNPQRQTAAFKEVFDQRS